MDEQTKRNKIRNYFKPFPKWAIWMILIGVVMLLGGASGSAGLAVIGLVVAGIGGFVVYSYGQGKATDQEMDQFLNEDLIGLGKHGLNKVGVDGTELVGEPVQVTGFPRSLSGAEFHYKKGKDNIIRFTPTQATLIFFTQNQLVAYSCAYDSTTGKPLNESTEEYFYRDVVAVSTKTTSVGLNLGKELGTIQATAAEEFTLTTSGGTSISVVLRDASLVQRLGGGDLPTTRAENAVQNVRRMLRDKKAANV
jgi:hypothetical protein